MSVSEKIKAARKRLLLTQEEAAIAWDVPIRTLQSWEQGLRTPRGLALRHLEQILSQSAPPGD